ncbi:hypothetical protein F5144DRAFT_594750 [Chaetomium tenue]|uniref:Uncharacterized protein n=1 Tax=Chaetomium tenue TaxID=1854479 RepID=A0ACB7P439_9PEZI|nr:hypothetical protein F5144DRAFT_594750 [Chaetomium globosum]
MPSALEPEFRVYQKLPQHDRSLQLIRYSPEEGFVLHYMPRGSLREHLREAAATATTITLPERLYTRFFLPRPLKEPPTVRTDIFSLGSTIYEIVTDRQPYEDLSDDEVEARYSRQIFPSVQEELLCGQVIMDCWRCEVQTAEEAMMRLKAEMESALKALDLACSPHTIPPTTVP